uniref:Protein kinase domain-containing protein n=1 Tax=Alexandrium catenella TaxID=2925 RepID=A0A7S1S0D7_ALECA|mmetsp:Transcript_80279/g.213050  ORF Transcript_80279/g.213050 Transcript_80279/m.213050 type:complete len:1014 (+) Transcript_80279:76-3117(+)
MQGLTQPSPATVFRRSPTASRREAMLTSSPSWYTPTTPTRGVGGPIVMSSNAQGAVIVQTPSRTHGRFTAIPCTVGSPLTVAAVQSPTARLTACASPVKSPTFAASPFALPTRFVEGIASAPGLEHTWRAVAGAASPVGIPDGTSTAQSVGKSRHQASSSASTLEPSGTSDVSPSEDASSRDEPATTPPHEQDRPIWWALGQTVALSHDCDLDELASRAKIVDKNALSSVKSAIEQLNRGTLQCQEGLCVVYSASSLGYFLLYRQDKREVAMALAASRPSTKDAAPRALNGSIAAVMTPQGLQLPLGETVRGLQPLAFEASTCWSSGSPMNHSPSLTSRPSQGRLSTPNRARCWSPGAVFPTGTPSRSRQSRFSAAPGSPKPSAAAQGTPARGSEQEVVQRVNSTPLSRNQLLGGDAEVVQRVNSTPMATRSQMLGGHSGSQSVARTRRSLPGPSSRAPSSPPTQERFGGAESSANVFTPRTSKRSLAPSMSPQASPHPRQGVRKSSIAPIVFAEAEEDAPAGGGEVSIKAAPCLSTEVIGRGAFGVVWRAHQVPGTSNENAEDPPDKEVAVKVVSAKDSSSFVAAAFEAELLRILTVALGRSGSHVPRYFAHSSSRSSSSASGGGTVRLAMSFVPGGALDKWLYGISDEEHKTVEVEQLVNGRLPGGQQGSWTLGRACSIVQELMLQLCGVFAALQPIAYHRDVSSHNVLVDFPNGPERPDFSLIDFGLSVRSGSWSREWRTSNLAGDPRYWTPSAWMAFAFGFKYVATHPNAGFQQQYLSRMDHFSFGVLGLETLFALWRSSDGHEGKHPGLLEMRAAWSRYWAAVIRLFQMFHMQGPQDVRHFLSQSQEDGVNDLVDSLRQLRHAARRAAEQPANAHCAALLLVLADLVDEKGTVTWGDLPTLLGEGFDSEVGGSSPTAWDASPSSPAMALIEESPSPTFERGTHSRIRSTGETLDRERQRLEPEASKVTATRRGSASVTSMRLSKHSESLSPDPITRSYSHVRRSSNYL